MHRLFDHSFFCRAVSLVMLSVSLNAGAEKLLDIKPYAAATVTFEDNLFRVSGSDEALAILGTDDMSDTIRRADVGVDADWKISRQHLQLALNLNRSRYNRFDFLDNNGNSNKLAWAWAIGSHLGGEISASESRYISGFTEVNNPVRNERTRKNNLIGANWDFHPRWKLHAQREEFKYENSVPSYRSSDKNEVAHDAAIKYVSPAGNSISLSAREVATVYPERDAFSTLVFGSSNRQFDKALNFAWQPDGKTRVNGRYGRIELKYEELSPRNVETWEGHLGADWQLGGKTTLSLSAVHDIYAVDDISASYVESDALSVSPTWAVSAKLMIKVRASYEERGYLGDPGFVLGVTPQRVEKLKTADLIFNYALRDKVHMQMSWKNESRDASEVNGGYRANMLNANVQIEY